MFRALSRKGTKTKYTFLSINRSITGVFIGKSPLELDAKGQVQFTWAKFLRSERSRPPARQGAGGDSAHLWASSESMLKTCAKAFVFLLRASEVRLSLLGSAKWSPWQRSWKLETLLGDDLGLLT